MNEPTANTSRPSSRRRRPAPRSSCPAAGVAGGAGEDLRHRHSRWRGAQGRAPGRLGEGAFPGGQLWHPERQHAVPLRASSAATAGTTPTFPATWRREARTVMDNVGEILKAAGMGHGDVVQSRVWYNAENSELNPVSGSCFEGMAPPVRTPPCANPPGADFLIEVSIVAVKDPSSARPSKPAERGWLARPCGWRAGARAIQVGNRLYISGMSPAARRENKSDAKAQTTETCEPHRACAQGGQLRSGRLNRGPRFRPTCRTWASSRT